MPTSTTNCAHNVHTCTCVVDIYVHVQLQYIPCEGASEMFL